MTVTKNGRWRDRCHHCCIRPMVQLVLRRPHSIIIMPGRNSKHGSCGHCLNPSLSSASERCSYQFSGANFDPYDDLPSFKHPSLPNLFRKPLGVCMKSGFFSFSCGKAFTQSTDIMIQFFINNMLMKVLIVGLCTTGA